MQKYLMLAQILPNDQNLLNSYNNSLSRTGNVLLLFTCHQQITLSSTEFRTMK